MKFFEKNKEKFENCLENFKSVLAVVEAGLSLLEFFRVSGGGERSSGCPWSRYCIVLVLHSINIFVGVMEDTLIGGPWGAWPPPKIILTAVL